MAYQSTVIEVMIASPSDVARERQIAREVVHRWNALNSKSTNTVLLPVMWETHASPVMGERAQEIINKEVLESCDLLVGIFWTRIGTPTGTFKSGTVEEIQKHIEAGKPAMLYFSLAPVIPDSVDPEQYKQLKEFRGECQQKGLIEIFNDSQDFEKKFTHQLALRVSQDDYLQSILKSSQGKANTVETTYEIPEPEPVGIPRLSEEAKQLLIEASNDAGGAIMVIRYMGGMLVQTNGKQFGDENNRRSQAMWESAVSELEQAGLVSDKSYKGEYYEVTHEGYQVADLLKAKRSTK
jgi:hypothetical protein